MKYELKDQMIDEMAREVESWPRESIVHLAKCAYKQELSKETIEQISEKYNKLDYHVMNEEGEVRP